MKPIAPLAALRRSRGFTIAQVAKSMKSNSPAVSDFEQGKSVVGESYIRRYARAIREPVRTVSISYWLAVEAYCSARLTLASQSLRRGGPRKSLRKLP